MSESDPGRTSRDAQASEGFNRILERLRGVVDKLEAGSLGLEDALAAFEEGVGLSRRGSAILDAAEQRVEILTRGGDGGERAVPFAAGEGDSVR